MKAYAYTDIAQSKKLAEILPLESADMHYSKDFDGSWFVDFAKYTSVTIPKYVGKTEEHLLPCWSLAALLSIIPDNIKIDGHRWGLSIRKNSISYLGSMTWDGQLNISVQSDNLVDACVAMLLKLHEQNIL